MKLILVISFWLSVALGITAVYQGKRMRDFPREFVEGFVWWMRGFFAGEIRHTNDRTLGTQFGSIVGALVALVLTGAAVVAFVHSFEWALK
jgi:hypothetical protein